MSSSSGSEDPAADTNALVSALDVVSLDAAAQASQHSADNAQSSPTRPLRVYTRAQLLNLYNSPLVQPPTDMPDLKSWFGTENEQNLAKRDADPSNPGSSRDRRFRRDFEDGETPSRPAFRSTLTQPSQMGNFKHQSLRDRDKDRDGDKDRERDIRDREGQERLRHLSDKYDRDRLSLSSSNARPKDKEAANSSTRTTAQTPTTGNTTRRGEPRDLSKRKLGEAGDDWRRGDLPRNGREDRSDTGRRDRERSRPRDSSKSRQDGAGRKDRGSDRDEARERPARDREDEEEARHWRDDGKREERVAARKTRERGGDHWEPSSDRPGDRRWNAAEERDGRYKRANGRDRRNGTQEEREDRKDREREKEKEPAWMETYVPNEPLPGILGAGSSTGELDGIQAWKKGLKEKDDKDSGNRPGGSGEESNPMPVAKGIEPFSEDNAPTQPLDEIQMFRLMMQKEKEKRVDPPEGSVTSLSIVAKPEFKSNPESLEVPTSANGMYDMVPSQSRDGGTKESSTRIDQGIVNPELSTSYEIPPSHPIIIAQEKPVAESVSHFHPPSGPRLLALGRGGNKPKAPSPVPFNPHTSNLDPTREAGGFSPFDDAAHQMRIERVSLDTLALPEHPHRVQGDRSPLNQHHQFNASPLDNAPDANTNGYGASKGSRFAKFFDGKTRDLGPPMVKGPTPIGFTSPSPNLGQRFDNNMEEQRTMDDIIAMLANSQQTSRPQNVNIASGLPSVHHNQTFNQQGIHQHHLVNANRSESLYDSRLDDRSFVPDGMVPGLRTAPLGRNRDPFSDAMDDAIPHIQRLAHQQQLQHRDFGAPLNSMFAQQSRGMGMPLQQQPYRGGVSPNSAQLRGLPPGLANLGSRPPHESSQFLGMPGPIPQQFNNYTNSHVGSFAYGNHQQFRGPPPSMNLQNAHLAPLGSLSQDPRLAGAHGFGHGLGGGGQRMQAQQRLGPGGPLGLRGPPHMQQQGQQGGTQDLMALLMGGKLIE